MTQQLPILFVPGTLCNARLFVEQVKWCEAQGIPVSVAKLDGGNSMASMARKILAQAPQQFALAGLSMGGIIAFEMYRQAPHRIRGLALIDTNAKPELPENAKTRSDYIAAIDKLETEGSDGLLPFVEYTLFPKYTAATGDTLTKLRREVLYMAAETGWAVGKQQLQALNTRPDSGSTLPQINVPTAIIYGEDDQLCPLDRHLYMHQHIPHATLHPIALCGHLSTMEQPEQVNALLYAWYQQVETHYECSPAL